MKKLSVFLISLFFLLSPVYAFDFDVSGKYVILYNLDDNKVLYSKNADKITKIASLTKIMTALVTIENVKSLDEEVTILKEDFTSLDGYSKAGFNINDKVTYLDLIYGILLPSGADAVNAAVNNTLGYDKFVEKMNQLASEIGMNDTFFSNPIGKDEENNYSTASDIAKLLKYALNNEIFKEVFTTRVYETKSGLLLKSTLSSYDNILNTNLIYGAKSGFTKEAGRCLASISNIDGANLLLVVINADIDKAYNAIKDTVNIYSYYKDNYSYQTIIDDNTFIKKVPIFLSNEKYYKVTGSERVRKYLQNDANIYYEYDGVDKISYRTKKGTKIGDVKIYNDDTLLLKSSVYLEEDLFYYPVDLVIGALVLCIVIVKIKRR